MALHKSAALLWILLLQKTNTYDFDSIEGIRNIPIPNYSKLNSIESPTNNIEYILQRKATEHKKNGRMDLAIECLRKSNEIMPHSNFSWSKKDYLRLVEYLKLDGKFEEARQEEELLKITVPSLFDEKTLKTSKIIEFKRLLKRAQKMDTDLLIVSSHNTTCEKCSIYQGRVYSISGKDARFPKLPDFILKYGCIHEGCRHSFNIYFEGINGCLNDDIAKSNRPFIDTRTQEEKELYEQKSQEAIEAQKDKKDYDYLKEHLPNICPKSLSGYRKMKHSNSKNYQLIVEEAKKIGYEI